MKRRLKKSLKIFFIFILTTSWLFAGWPQIWENPKIPPEVQKVKAASCADIGTDLGDGRCRVILTTADSSPWTVPEDWDSGTAATVEAVGGGKGGSRGADRNSTTGAAGGAGGGYAKITNFNSSAGSTVSFSVGAGGAGATTASTAGTNGGDTWFSSSGTVLAAGGGTGTTQVGSTTYAGGAAGTLNAQKGGSGGGGAAGPRVGAGTLCAVGVAVAGVSLLAAPRSSRSLAFMV